MATKRKQPSTVVSTNPKKQLGAFADAVLGLAGRAPTPKEWDRIRRLFAGYESIMPKTAVATAWRLSREYRAGKFPISGDRERWFRAFVEFGRLRDAAWKKFARETGYWQRKHEERKSAADPDDFRAAAAARKRKSREKQRQAKEDALYEQFRAESIDIEADIEAIRAQLAAENVPKTAPDLDATAGVETAAE